MRISDWSSDVCSSDLLYHQLAVGGTDFRVAGVAADAEDAEGVALLLRHHVGGADAIPGARIEAEDLGEPAQVGNLLLGPAAVGVGDVEEAVQQLLRQDRKSTRLNSSH